MLDFLNSLNLESSDAAPLLVLAVLIVSVFTYKIAAHFFDILGAEDAGVDATTVQAAIAAATQPLREDIRELRGEVDALKNDARTREVSPLPSSPSAKGSSDAETQLGRRDRVSNGE